MRNEEQRLEGWVPYCLDFCCLQSLILFPQMGGLGGGFPGLGGSGPSPAMLQQLMNMRGLGGSMPGAEGGSTPSAATPEPAVNYEERFATQLQTMSEMGFTDTAKCLRALVGNVSDWQKRV